MEAMTQKTPAPVKREKCVFSCTDRLCQTLDQIGVPEDEKWRSLILYMRSLNHYDTLTPDQKSEIQAEVLAILKAKDFSAERYRTAVARIEEIVSAPYRRRLEAALSEASRVVNDFEGMIKARKKDVQHLESTTLDTVMREKEPEAIVSRLRSLFSEVLAAMDRDAEVLTRMSRTDALTGLYNRRGLDIYLEEAVVAAAVDDRPLSLLMFDIDHFKAFNDHYGHLIGDQALVTVARILAEQALEAGEAAGRSFFPARFGGEEFCLVLPGLDRGAARELAETVRHLIESFNFVIRGSDGRVLESGIRMTVSVGVAANSLAWQSAPAQSLINAADMALYQAKHLGRNRVCIFEE